MRASAILTVVAIPSRSSPDRTVRFSAVGCQCNGISYPAVNCRRSTNGPRLKGSPYKTETFPPGGKPGGAKLIHVSVLSVRETLSGFSTGAAVGAGIVVTGASSDTRHLPLILCQMTT